MKIKEYLGLAEKTLSNSFNTSEKTEKILHGAIGISTEAGEILDQLKKVVYYNAKLDVVNIEEEIGDLMWYVAIMLRELDLDFDKILDKNIDKLKARYGEKFSSEAAAKRNLGKERKILERK